MNECESYAGACDVDASCVNENGGYNCKCNAGFIGDGLSCTDPNNQAILKIGRNLAPQGEVRITLKRSRLSCCGFVT